eukprot:sb/3467423/
MELNITLKQFHASHTDWSTPDRATKGCVENKEKLKDELRDEVRGEVEEVVRGEVKQEVDALRAELDLKSEETALLKKEVALLQEQEEVASSARGEQLEALTSHNATLTNEVVQLKADLARKTGLLGEIRRRLTGLSERESDLEEEIRLLHECKMPNGAKEIAREAVRLKRRNALLEDRLEGLTGESAPNVEPLVVEKLQELKEEKEVLVKRVVAYQKHLETLSVQHPAVTWTTELTAYSLPPSIMWQVDLSSTLATASRTRTSSRALQQFSRCVTLICMARLCFGRSLYKCKGRVRT